MRALLHKHTVSFQHAFEGVVWAFKSQPNFRIHAILSFVAIFASYVFGITATERLIIVFTIILGFIVEMVNTCIEAMTDLITTEWRAQAKVAKDVAAGMMLLTAFGALLISAYIFLPYVFA